MGFRDDEDDPIRHQQGRVFLQKQSIGSRRSSKSFDVSPNSLASIESLSMPLGQEVVLPADIRCAECQKRVADVIYRMNGTESVLVNVWEKMVILSSKNPDPKTPRSKRQVVSYKTPSPFNKIAVIKRIFRSSLGYCHRFNGLDKKSIGSTARPLSEDISSFEKIYAGKVQASQVDLARNGNGTGVFIPTVYASRRRVRPGRFNQRRGTYKQVGKIIRDSLSTAGLKSSSVEC